MSGKDRPQNVINGLAHKHYSNYLSGDGATVEFDIGGTLDRAEDVLVFVAGLLMRGQDGPTANDFAVRGFAPGYDGEKNRIKFVVAPAGGAKIDIWRIGG